MLQRDQELIAISTWMNQYGQLNDQLEALRPIMGDIEEGDLWHTTWSLFHNYTQTLSMLLNDDNCWLLYFLFADENDTTNPLHVQKRWIKTAEEILQMVEASRK